jgi:HD domain-containing protein
MKNNSSDSKACDFERRSTRRHFTRTLASSVAASCAAPILARAAGATRKMQPSSDRRSEVAGVRIVDSKIAQQAEQLAREASPRYLFNHALRTYLFGSLIGRANGWKFDPELLFLACILHDLGLTERFATDLPFEIAGAEAAAHFLREQNVTEERAGVVWDGIAMHPSVIGAYKRPEVRLVGAGAGADVVGPNSREIPDPIRDEVVEAVPRLGFKTAFVDTCASVVRRHPRGAARSFMRDIGERYVQGFSSPNICDAIARSPFRE